VPGVLFFRFSVSYSDVVMLILVGLDSQAPTLTAILSCICSASVVTAQNRGKLHIFTVSLQWGFHNRGSVCVSVTLFFLALDLDAELWIVNLWWMDFIECCWCCCLDFKNKVCVSVIVNGVARVRRRGEYSTSNLGSVYSIYLANMGGQENLVFYRWKVEWESPPSILVTRNPNWSQRSGTGTGCVKGRY
jgi:hypothetical protein